MDSKLKLDDILFSTPFWRVLNFLLQHPDQELMDSEISPQIEKVKKSAVNVALRRLKEIGFIDRHMRGRQAFNRLVNSLLVTHLKIVSNIVEIKPLTDRMISYCFKIVLFGSRADGTNMTDSDFDIFVVTDNKDEINKLVRKNYPKGQIQLIAKSNEEMLTFQEESPVLRHQIEKGIVLWEKK